MSLWVIMVFTQYFYLTLSESKTCSDVLFEFNSACFAECPEFTKHITGSNVCTEKCPDTAPIAFKETCVKQCPDGYYRSDKFECIKLQVQQKIANLYHSSLYRGCPSNYRCLSSRPFCYKLQCFQTCPENTKLYGSQCLDACPHNVPFVLNDTCVKECPSTHKFIMNNTCCSSCRNGFNVYGTKCVKTCPHNTFLFNSHCLHHCPDNNPFVVTLNNASVCHEICPAFTAANGNACEHFCPDSRPFLFNRTCLKLCPITHSYLLYKETANFALRLCLDCCPQDRFIDGHVCVKQCAGDMKLLDHMCVEECPNKTYVELVGGFQTCVVNCSLQTPYLLENKCISVCPNGTFIVDSYFCANDCPTSKPLVNEQLECVDKCYENDIQYQNKCLSNCPDYLKEFEASCVDNCNKTNSRFEMNISGLKPKCLSMCPENTFINAFECVSECPLTSNYVLDKTCYSTCPLSHPYHKDYGIYALTKQKVCLKTCGPDEYRFKDICDLSCPESWKIFGSECVEDCKLTSKPLQNDNHCVQECPRTMLNNSFECVPLCPASARYIFNRTCRSACPTLYPYLDRYVLGGNFRCVASCNKFKLINTSMCLDKCLDGTFEHQDTCVYECPGDSPFISIDKKCVSSCSLYLNKSCVDICPAKMCERNKTCVSESNYGLIYIKDVGKKYLNVCVDACPNNAIRIGRACVDYCPTPYVYFNNSCQHHCPSAYPFIEDVDRGSKCVMECSYNKVIFQGQCQERCPSDTFIMPNRTCVKKCPKFLPYLEETSSGKECKENCSKSKYSDGNLCIIECPWTKRFMLNNVCVSSCPVTHKFVLNEECLLGCSGDNVQIYNISECIKKTDCYWNGNYILDKYCVETCPKNTIPNKHRTCVHIPSVTFKQVLALLCFPLLGLCICYCYNGNDRINLRIPGKDSNKYEQLQVDIENEETCVMEIANSNSIVDVTSCREANSTGDVTPCQRETDNTGDDTPCQRETDNTGDVTPCQRETHSTGDVTPCQRETHSTGNVTPCQRETHSTGDVTPCQRETQHR